MKVSMIAGILLFVIAGGAFAQNPGTATLRWASSHSVELRSDTTLFEAFEITTSSTQIQVLHQAVTKTFEIESVDGSWTDVDQEGALVYQLMFGAKEGTAILQREDGQWTFTLDFSAHKDGVKRKFILSGYEEL